MRGETRAGAVLPPFPSKKTKKLPLLLVPAVNILKMAVVVVVVYSPHHHYCMLAPTLYEKHSRELWHIRCVSHIMHDYIIPLCLCMHFRLRYNNRI